MNRKTFCISLLLLILTEGCSDESDMGIPADIADIENLTIIETNLSTIPVLYPEPVLTLGNTDSTTIGMMTSMVSDDSGRIFIADSQQRLVQVFGPTGSRITTLGRNGDGPGEFRGLGELRIGGGYLHVLDPSLLRISRFDIETLQFNGSTDISTNGSPSEHFLPQTYFVRPDGSYLMILTGPPVQGETDQQRMWDTVVLNRDGSWSDSIHMSVPAAEWLFDFTDDYQISLRPPYGRTSLLQADRNGQLFHIWSEELLIKSYNPNGLIEKAWYLDYSKTTLHREEVMSEFESRSVSQDPRFIRLLRNQSLPETWPAINNLLLDDEGRLWISAYTENPNQWRWLVLNPFTENVEGTFIWPRTRHIHEVRDGFIYTWKNETDTEIQTLNKYNF